jgi:hypothetical protein
VIATSRGYFQRLGFESPRAYHIFEWVSVHNIRAREKEVGTSAEVHVLLHFHRDLLLVQRCAVFHKARMNDHMVRQ